MNFFKRFGSSIYGFKSYNVLRKTSKGSTFLYLLVLVLILSIATAFRPMIAIRNYNKVMHEALDNKIKTMELNSGALIVNGGEEIVTYGEDKNTYFVIDTKGEVDKDKFLGKSGIILRKDGFQVDFGSITNNSIATSEVDTSYSKAGLGNINGDILGVIGGIVGMFNGMLIFALPIYILIGNAIIALLYALVSGIFAGSKDLKLSFGEKYKISIYAMTTIILAKSLLALVGIGVPFVVSFLVVSIYLFMAIKAIKEEEIQDLIS